VAKTSIHDVVKEYGSYQAVCRIGLEIADEESIVPVGPSECGKSMTLRMTAGLEDITSEAVNVSRHCRLGLGLGESWLLGWCRVRQRRT